MLVVNRENGSFSDHAFTEFPSYLRPDDVLVLNNTKVFPARLLGTSSTGAKVEIFLVSELGDGKWRALARPARRLQPGKRIDFGGKLAAQIVDKASDGIVLVQFDGDADFFAKLDEVGRTPLPPYIKRENSSIDTDRERYQTVFAAKRGAIAAPTAGLHFTSDALNVIRKRGISVLEITLHVGYGTFEPVRVVNLSEHKVSAENYEIDAETALELNHARTAKRRIVAVGTTTTRALESNLAQGGRFIGGSYSADLTITPGYRFRAVDALLTNFHLPESSLLVLTSTFGGHELIMSAYRHAVDSQYRFYSYGDCMLIE